MYLSAHEKYLKQVRDAYSRLTHEQLLLFLTARSLPTHGTDNELASRLAHHDIHTYCFPPDINCPTLNGGHSSGSSTRLRQVRAPDLPVEILAEIMDHVGDWELAKAVGVPTSLPQPQEWTHANQMDHAILTGYLPLIRSVDPATQPPTRIGAELAVRLGYVKILEYFLMHHSAVFKAVYKCDLLPITASHHGRVSVLVWWARARIQYPDIVTTPSRQAICNCIDGASRNGQVVSLDWWLHSGMPLEYSEVALEMASAKNQLEVLAWWKQQSKEHGLQMKVGRVMDMASTAGHVEVLEWWSRALPEVKYDRLAMYHASCHGKVDVLQWWLNSGLQLIFDADALIGATRHNRPDVLEWWDRSGLPIQYRMCDIEEALEDAIGGGEAARLWWNRKGVDFNANDKEWMKAQSLN